MNGRKLKNSRLLVLLFLRKQKQQNEQLRRRLHYLLLKKTKKTKNRTYWRMLSKTKLLVIRNKDNMSDLGSFVDEDNRFILRSNFNKCTLPVISAVVVHG